MRRSPCVSPKFCTMLHTSCSFREAFQARFGKKHEIRAVVSTRWNSTLRRVQAVVELEAKSMGDVLEAQGQGEGKPVIACGSIVTIHGGH